MIQLVDLRKHERPRDAYEAIRAVGLDGKTKWAWVYLIQTEGRNVRAACSADPYDVIEFASLSKISMLPGDDFFYVVHDADCNMFGSLAMKVAFDTGLPLSRNKRIKAVNADEFQAFIDQMVLAYFILNPENEDGLHLLPASSNNIAYYQLPPGNTAYTLLEFINEQTKKRYFTDIQ